MCMFRVGDVAGAGSTQNEVLSNGKNCDREYIYFIYEPIPLERHNGGFKMDFNSVDIERRMLTYRLYRGHDISTVCVLFPRMEFKIIRNKLVYVYVRISDFEPYMGSKYFYYDVWLCVTYVSTS